MIRLWNVSRLVALALAIATLAACAGPARPVESGAPSQDAPAQPRRTLVLITRQETPSVSGTALVPGNFTTGSQRRPFNAWLTYGDANDTPVPYLAEALPQLNTDTWKVFPDGKMETTYRLEPNLTWHDGTPLSGEDFVFGWKVYASPDFGVASTRPHVAFEEANFSPAETSQGEVASTFRSLLPPRR